MRRKLAFNGAAAVTLVVDDRGKLLADPQVMLAGVVNYDLEDIEAEIADEIADAIALLKSSRDDAALEQAAIKAMRGFLRGLTGRKPVCQVQIVRMP